MLGGLKDLKALEELDAQFWIVLKIAENPALPLGDAHVTELGGGEFIAPVTEGSFRELHDVAFVYQGDVALVALQSKSMLDRFADMTLAAVLAYRLDADA